MIQEFFKTTLVSKFIKQLLATTPIPIYKFINDNDDMIEGCVYSYKDRILKCTKSGRFLGTRGTSLRNDYLYVQEPLFVSDDATMDITRWDSVAGEYITTPDIPLAVTDDIVSVKMYPPAEYDTVSRFDIGDYVPGVNQTYVSNYSYYDEETHKQLGEYLRYVSNVYEVDLMPLYNCFNHKLVTDISLFSYIDSNGKVQQGVSETPSKITKTFLIPIKFDNTYTIAIDSDFPVLMKAVFYNNGLLWDTNHERLLSDYLKETVVEYSNMTFSQPVTYTLPIKQVREKDPIDAEKRRVQQFDMKDTYYPMLHNYERYLYLAIQLPSTNASTITVLEGDYSDIAPNSVIDIKGIQSDMNTSEAVSRMMVSKLSLLETNDGIQRPFADKLIQYLLGNTIDNRELIDNNVSSIEDKVGYHPLYKGIWDDELRHLLFTRYMTLQDIKDMNFTDILGYVDSDIERAVRKGYLS